MGYIFDTNIWIDLDWRKIPRDSFPSLWEKIEAGVANGTVFTLDMVYDELQATAKKDDRLAKWIREQRAACPEFVLDSTADVQTIAIGLINKHKLQNNADPFLVAAAKEHNLTVVCHEKLMKQNEKPRVPNLCQELGVPCIALLDMIKQNDWVF
jgi:predicted nucleic acid-binding protein